MRTNRPVSKIGQTERIQRGQTVKTMFDPTWGQFTLAIHPANGGQPVLDAGLMEWCATGGPKPRCTGWLRLTESGAAIVQDWLDKWTKEVTK